MKKLLFTFIIVITSVAVQSQITMTTNSVDSGWTSSLQANLNSGALLHWEATNSVLNGGVPLIADTNDVPIFNFESNDGSPITITVSNVDGFSGLTRFWVTSAELTSIDVTNGVNITNLNVRNNPITTLDVSTLIGLTKLYALSTDIVSLDISQNDLLTTLQINNAALTTVALDQIVNDLDANGESNGDLQITNQSTGDLLSFSAQPGYDNLIGKGWTIDVSAPADITPPTIGILNTPTNVATTSLTLDWTAATDDIGVTEYNVYKDAVLEVTLGNVLTYNVTGLTPGTNYDFYVTALDAAGNESTASNTQNVTTNLPVTTITMTTNSVDSGWTSSLQANLNSGALLHWEATNSVLNGGVPLIADTNDVPIFNFESNDGSPITITVSNVDGFSGLTRFWVTSAELTSIDVTNGVNITNLNVRNNPITTLDVSTLIGLTKLYALSTDIVSLDISQNDLLTTLQINNAALTTVALDQIVNDLDANGESNGDLQITNNVGTLTTASLVAYNNLIAKNWMIDVPPPTAAAGPEINVTGNSQSIPSGNTPIVADDTDFGQVAIGSPVTKTFTIENLGDSNLTITNNALYNTDFTQNTTDFEMITGGIPSGGFPPQNSIVLTPGSQHVFEVIFDPQNTGTQSVLVGIVSDDLDEENYVVNLTAEGIPAGNDPTIEVYGAGDETTGVLITNGNFNNDIIDATDFGIIQNSISKTHTYTIFNSGDANLDISSISVVNFGGPPNEFALDNDPSPITLAPGTSTTFNVAFLSTVTGVYTGMVQINHSDTDTSDPYQFGIMGESSAVAITGDLMITQYYEGGGDNQWIEIKNISGASITAGDYFLCLYDDSILPVIGLVSPTASEPIPAMAIDEVLLFKKVAIPVTPSGGNIGGATQIETPVCDFTGNDAIIISLTDDGTSYGNRQDMIGNADGSRWGQGTSFIRGGCVSELPEVDFDINNWIDLGSSAIVDAADVNSNIALGTQFIGVTTWTGSTWDNGLADYTRNGVIASPYSASDGTIEVCSLTINANVNFDGGTEESVIVHNDLTINAPFTLGDQESLVTYDPNALIIGNITKNENSTSLNDIHDNTYWSSPVNNSNLGTVFSGVDPNRIFFLDGASVNAQWAGTEYEHWFVASGSMQIARGYSVEGASAGIQSVSFVGVPNNGTITIPVHYKGSLDVDPENDNFNLLGNPYPAALFLDSFLSDSQHANIEGTIYLWNHATVNSGGIFDPADYASYSVGTGGVAAGSGGEVPNGHLASGQGFMVRTTGNQSFVTFENDDVIPGENSQFFKQNISKKQDANKEEKDRVWLNLTTNDGGFSQILIGFFDGATDGKDRSFDGLKLKAGNPITFYSQIENSKYVIQGLSAFTADKTVVLGFDTEVAKTFNIGIDQIEGTLKDSDVYLVDNLLGITHNLKDSDYTFEQTTTGEFKNRFTLQFAGAALDVDDVIANNEFVISNEIGNLKINSGKAVNNIKVYDLLGRMLLQEKPNKKSFSLNTNTIKDGTVLLIEANLENGSVVSKKTIKY